MQSADPPKRKLPRTRRQGYRSGRSEGHCRRCARCRCGRNRQQSRRFALREQELDEHGPRLRHRPPQGRQSRASGSSQAKAPGHRQWPRSGNLFRAPDIAADHQPALRHHRAGRVSTISLRPFRAVASRARLGAVKHGISQALTRYEPELRATVKAAGFLTRDSRVVERKKYGRAKARRSFQFSKR